MDNPFGDRPRKPLYTKLDVLEDAAANLRTNAAALQIAALIFSTPGAEREILKDPKLRRIREEMPEPEIQRQAMLEAAAEIEAWVNQERRVAARARAQAGGG